MRGAHTTRRKRKIRCTTKTSSPMMTICIDDAAAMVGSPCHWISEKMCTGRLVDCGPVRNSARLMSENEMMKAKIAPETRLDRNSGNVTLKNACTRVGAKAHRCFFETGVEPDKAGGNAADHIGRADH